MNETSAGETFDEQELAASARAIIDRIAYMTLATADADGFPWASPVWYAPEAYTEFFWVSDPQARHSRNLAVRPQLGIVIFDSTVPIGAGQGVYIEARAETVVEPELQRGMEIFSRRSEAQGGHRWTRADVIEPARLRLYRAVAGQTFALTANDRRLPVTIPQA
jgi:uncharacterized protein YhbP (UPF0306 family)